MIFVLITGLSGAGKSQAAGILEDMGYYCVDNLPVELMPRFVDLCLAAEEKYNKVALVSDVRGQDSFGKLTASVEEARLQGLNIRVLYMEASAEAILKRYKETRRRHPLDPDGGGMEAAIAQERRLTEPLKELADLVIDTTDYPLAKLRQRLAENFEADQARSGMAVHVCSFGYKYGLPAEADLVLDVRFLPNPFYVQELRPYSGLDSPVRDFVLSFPQTADFLRRLEELLNFLLPWYEAEGKPSLMLAVGCTGGRHRSVALAEAIAAAMTDMGWRADCLHRDLKQAE